MNHAMFISWKEFVTYLEDYRPIEVRNKSDNVVENPKDKLKKEKALSLEKTIDPEEEQRTLMSKEVERRTAELPKMRLAD
jgi:hypothetical protein